MYFLVLAISFYCEDLYFIKNLLTLFRTVVSVRAALPFFDSLALQYFHLQ